MFEQCVLERERLAENTPTRAAGDVTSKALLQALQSYSMLNKLRSSFSAMIGDIGFFPSFLFWRELLLLGAGTSMFFHLIRIGSCDCRILFCI